MTSETTSSLTALESLSRQEQQRLWCEQAVKGHHGAFAESLAQAFNRADDGNADRLAKAFPELFDCLAAVGKKG